MEHPPGDRLPWYWPLVVVGMCFAVFGMLSLVYTLTVPERNPMPVAAVTVIATPVSEIQVEVDCPHCSDSHVHGRGTEGRTGNLGHRVADCGKGGYYVHLPAE